MNKTIATQRLTYFTVFWALVLFMEQMLHKHEWFFVPTDQIFIVAIILALCFPSTLAALVFLAAASLAHLFFATTNYLDNIAFESLINFTILMAVGLSFVNRKSWGFENKDIYLRLAPLIRIFLVTFYFFTFFTKLNTGFLDPDVSCAVRAVDEFLKQWFGTFPIPWPKPMAIWATLIIESSLPIMLIFKRTRNTAIVIGLCFHLILGFMVRVWGFSMLMGMLYFVFLSDRSFYLIQHWGEKFKSIIIKALPHVVIRVLAVLLLVCVSLTYFSEINSLNRFCFWMVLYSLMIVVFILSIFLSQLQGPAVNEPTEGSYFLPRPVWLLALVLPLLASGFSPFIGVRTVGCITLFSNLRTEGPKPNHLILGPSVMIFKQELIKILDSNDRHFKPYIKDHYLLTEYEFRRLANSIHGNLYVRCLYKGKVTTVFKINDGPSDHPLLKPIPWLEQKFIRFLPVDELEHCRCQEVLKGLFYKKMRVFPPH